VEGGKELGLGFFGFGFVVVVLLGRAGASAGLLLLLLVLLLLLLEDGGSQLSFGLVEGRGQATDGQGLCCTTTAAAAAVVTIAGVVVVVMVVLVHAVLFLFQGVFDQGPEFRLNVRGRHVSHCLVG
jgi:hypothetical protein